jgi:hypothetical protein
MYWPDGSLEALLEAGLVQPASDANSLTCPGCENQCFMDVHMLPGRKGRPDRAFIVCDDPEMQPQMGRIAIPLEYLKQWQATPLLLARVIARLLDIESEAEDSHGQTGIRVGMVAGNQGRQMLVLNKSPLTLETDSQQFALEEILFFDDGVLLIDRKRIENPSGRMAVQDRLDVGSPEWRSETARKAADARHNQPGGSRDKQRQIREIWATGKYSSRDRCAEEECAALDMSFSAARKALRNTPDPNT